MLDTDWLSGCDHVLTIVSSPDVTAANIKSCTILCVQTKARANQGVQKILFLLWKAQEDSVANGLEISWGAQTKLQSNFSRTEYFIFA